MELPGGSFKPRGSVPLAGGRSGRLRLLLLLLFQLLLLQDRRDDLGVTEFAILGLQVLFLLSLSFGTEGRVLNRGHDILEILNVSAGYRADLVPAAIRGLRV